MKKTDPLLSEADIVKALSGIDSDPESFNAFIEHWNSIFSIGRQEGPRDFAKIEAAALASVEAADSIGNTSFLGRQVGPLLERFDTPAYLVERNGRVAAQNRAAIQTFDIAINGTLDALPFDLEKGEPISDAITGCLNPLRNMQDAVLKRAYGKDDENTATLSIAPSKSNDGKPDAALVFVIDGRWATNAADLFRREFDLSKAEQDLLVAFLDGQTTQMMAASRQRAHATIRTQFHSVMSKMGARTQTELLRNALSVSQFADQIEEIANVMRHPYRKRVDIVRPGGRSVEVTMSGAFGGKPIVLIQSGVRYTFQSKTEHAFREANLCVLSICRPGFGDTDPAPADQQPDETFAGDLGSLLDQLGYTKCLMMSEAMSSGAMYRIAPYVTERVSGLVQVAAAAPANYFRDIETSVSWAQGMLNAAARNPSLLRLMLKTSTRAWKALGQKNFRKMAFRMDKVEFDLVMQPEALLEADAALNTATKQGFDAIISDMASLFSDFRDVVANTSLPILAIHGSSDPVFRIEATRRFSEDFKSRMTLIEISDAGFSAMSTHAKMIAGHIEDFYDENHESPMAKPDR